MIEDLASLVQRGRTYNVSFVVMAQLAGDVDRVACPDRLGVPVQILPRHSEPSGVLAQGHAPPLVHSLTPRCRLIVPSAAGSGNSCPSTRRFDLTRRNGGRRPRSAPDVCHSSSTEPQASASTLGGAGA